MAFEKLRIKKGVKLISIFLAIVMAVFIFGAIFNFTIDNAVLSDVDIDPKYNQTAEMLKTSREDIRDLTNRTRDSLNQVTEADNIAQVAWNGLKGMLAVFRIPIVIFALAGEMVEQLFSMLEVIPGEVKTTIVIVVSILSVFALVRYIAQRGNDA